MLKTSMYRGNGSLDRFRHYSIGLSTSHRLSFRKEIVRICSLYPWSLRSGSIEITDALVSCAQSDMLFQTSAAMLSRSKAAAFIPVSVFVNEKSFVIILEIIEKLFDYHEFAPRLSGEHYCGGYYTGMTRHSMHLSDYAVRNKRYMLKPSGPEPAGEICDEDSGKFIIYEDEFIHDSEVMWKRLSGRIRK